MLKVRLYRPFDAERFVEALPDDRAQHCRARPHERAGQRQASRSISIASMRLYEQGRSDLRVVGGRYGLSSKEFTPAMIKAVFDNLAEASPKNHFTVGIDDDLCTRVCLRSRVFHRTG